MATRSRSPHAGPVGRKRERILHILQGATADSTHIIEADFAAQLAQVRHAYDLLQGELYVLHGQDVDDQVQDEHCDEGLDEKESMPKNELSNRSGYGETTHDGVRLLIRKAVEEHEKKQG